MHAVKRSKKERGSFTRAEFPAFTLDQILRDSFLGFHNTACNAGRPLFRCQFEAQTPTSLSAVSRRGSFRESSGGQRDFFHKLMIADPVSLAEHAGKRFGFYDTGMPDIDDRKLLEINHPLKSNDGIIYVKPAPFAPFMKLYTMVVIEIITEADHGAAVDPISSSSW